MLHGFLDNYTQSILIFTGINVIAAYSFFAPFKTGQVSLGQAGFMAIGAYASGIVTQKIGPALCRCAADRRHRCRYHRGRRWLPCATHQGGLSPAAHARLFRDHAGRDPQLGLHRRRAGLPQYSLQSFDHGMVLRFDRPAHDLLCPARTFKPRPRHGLHRTGRNRRRGHGYRRRAHQAFRLRRRRGDSGACRRAVSPTRPLTSTRPRSTS